MPVISGGQVGIPGKILYEEVTYTEAGAAGTYEGSVTIPIDSWLLDVKIFNHVAWGAGTDAIMVVGDAATADGWITDLSTKATDIVAGANAEVVDFNNAGGKPGAYLVAATGERAEMYAPAERVITGKITTTGGTSTAGRTRMLVIYTDPVVPLAATYTAT